MEWLPRRGKKVAINTAPLIYFVEEDPAYLKKENKRKRRIYNLISEYFIVVKQQREIN